MGVVLMMFEFLIVVLTPGKTGAGSVVAGPCSDLFVPTQQDGSGVQLAAAVFSSLTWLDVVLFFCCVAFVVLMLIGILRWFLRLGTVRRRMSLEASIEVDMDMDGKELAARIDNALLQVRGVRSVCTNLHEDLPDSELIKRQAEPHHFPIRPGIRIKRWYGGDECPTDKEED